MPPLRNPQPPPNLEGYSFLHHLGSGGYADVYLYEKHLPKMQVAIKVLLSNSLSKEDKSKFYDEANTMAAFASHPFIVPILSADVTKDNKPYIVMQYYPGGNLSLKVRQNPLTVPESLRIGIEIAGAVETAHRSGILHRDIKPANILINEFGQPGLTDFGISLSIDKAEKDNEEGLSIPWSPPEIFNNERVVSETSDVYSLGATVYTLLTGRSPFELVNGSNRQIDLIQRIHQSPLPPTNRRDVPTSLERYLAQAMSKSPESRPQSAYEFAQGLQATEIDLKLQPTTIIVPDTIANVNRTSSDSLDATRFKSITSIDAQIDEIKSVKRDSSKPWIVVEPSRSSKQVKHVSSPSNNLENTVMKSTSEVNSANETTDLDKSRRSPTKIIVFSLIGLALIIFVVFFASSSILSGAPSSTTSTTSISTSPNAVYNVVPSPTNLSLARFGSSVYASWSNPSPEPGDTFYWKITNDPSNMNSHTTTATQITLPNLPSTPNPCISVEMVRSYGTPSQWVSSCLS